VSSVNITLAVIHVRTQSSRSSLPTTIFTCSYAKPELRAHKVKF